MTPQGHLTDGTLQVWLSTILGENLLILFISS